MAASAQQQPAGLTVMVCLNDLQQTMQVDALWQAHFPDAERLECPIPASYAHAFKRAVAYTTPHWHFAYVAVTKAGFKALIAAPKVEALARIVRGGVFQSTMLNVVEAPAVHPDGSLWPADTEVVIVSTIVRALFAAWLPAATTKSLSFVPVWQVTALGVTESFFSVALHSAEVAHCQQLAAAATFPDRPPRDAPALHAMAPNPSKAMTCLVALTRKTLVFEAKASPFTPRAEELLRVNAKDNNVFIAAAGFGYGVIDAAALLHRSRVLMVPKPDAPPPGAAPVDKKDQPRDGFVSVQRQGDKLLSEIAKRAADDGIMWPLAKHLPGMPASLYLVRREVLDYATVTNPLFDVIEACDEAALVRFAHPRERTQMVAESRWNFESVASCAFRPRRQRTHFCDATPYLEGMKAPLCPVIAIDTREARMKDDAFQAFVDPATGHIVLRHHAATPLTGEDMAAPFLQAPLLLEARERVVSIVDSATGRKEDMISRTKDYSLSHAHSKAGSRRVVTVEARFDPDTKQLIEAGPHAPTVSLTEQLLHVELTSGMYNEWVATQGLGPASLSRLLDPRVDTALRLVQAVAEANRHIGEENELRGVPFDGPTRSTTSTMGYESYRGHLYRHKVRAPTFGDVRDKDFKFFTNRTFAHVVNLRIAQRYGVALYSRMPPTFADDVTAALKAAVARALPADSALAAAVAAASRPLTRQEWRAVFRHCSGDGNITMSAIKATLRLTDGNEMHEIFACVGDEITPPLATRVLTDLPHLCDVIRRPEAPRSVPAALLGGTSGLRKYEHLLAQYLVAYQPPPHAPLDDAARTLLADELRRTATSLQEFEGKKRGANRSGLLRYLADPMVPAEKKRLLSTGYVADGGLIYMPDLEVFVRVVDAAATLGAAPFLSEVAVFLNGHLDADAPPEVADAGEPLIATLDGFTFKELRGRPGHVRVHPATPIEIPEGREGAPAHHIRFLALPGPLAASVDTWKGVMAPWQLPVYVAQLGRG